jgi:hypothetical protein
MAARGVRHFVAATAVVAIVAYAALFARLDATLTPIRSDGYSYYVYLPSVFLYHDLSLERLANDSYGGLYPDFTGIRRWPSTGRWMNLHPIGTALLMTPFFVAADLLSRWSNLPRDGFSIYYQHGAGLAGLTCFLLGLAMLRRMLIGHFSDGVVLATLICITWGTNLFHYGVFDGTFSHAYAFFLVCVWIWLVERWWDEPTAGRSLALGVIAALNVLTRHTNAIYLLVLPLYGVTRWSDVAVRIAELRDRWPMLAVAVLAGTAIVLPQLALYKWITGAWIVNSYATFDIGFSFGSPRVIATLFSTQKGLFFWSPVLLLSGIGVVVARGWARGLALPAVVVFALQTYLIASWGQWQFGASFGHRGFTDGFALAAPFIASCFEWAARRRAALVVISVGATAAVLLSVAQMAQYWMGILPMADTTWTQYRALFLRFQ